MIPLHLHIASKTVETNDQATTGQKEKEVAVQCYKEEVETDAEGGAGAESIGTNNQIIATAGKNHPTTSFESNICTFAH